MAEAQVTAATASEVVSSLPKVTPQFPLVLQPVHEKSFEQLRTINTAVLPVTYSESFYRDFVSTAKTNQWSFLAWLNNVVVGNITCRLHDPSNKDAVYPNHLPADPGSLDLYVMTLCVLTPYRRLGVGHALLQRALEAAAADDRIGKVVLHVQTTNTAAIRFYEANGLTKAPEALEKFYPRLEEGDAYFFSLELPRPAKGEAKPKKK